MDASEYLGWSAETWGVVIAAAGLSVMVVKFVTDRRAPDQDSGAVAAAERLNEIQEEALEADRRRERRELVASLKEMGPRWEAHERGEAGYFISDGEQLTGDLRNTGLHTAHVTLARLDLDGQVASVAVKCDPPHGGAGFTGSATVPPGSVMSMLCSVGGMRLEGSARPSIYMEFTSVGSVVGQLGVTIQLLRTGEDPRGHPQWRVGEVRSGVLA